MYKTILMYNCLITLPTFVLWCWEGKTFISAVSIFRVGVNGFLAQTTILIKWTQFSYFKNWSFYFFSWSRGVTSRFLIVVGTVEKTFTLNYAIRGQRLYNTQSFNAGRAHEIDLTLNLQLPKGVGPVDRPSSVFYSSHAALTALFTIKIKQLSCCLCYEWLIFP